MGVIVKDGTPDGTSTRKHLESAASLGGRTPGSASAIKRLDNAPECPLVLLYLWGWFVQLSAGRASGPMGSSGISFQDVDAWARLMDHQPKPHEVNALMMMDVTFRNAQSKQRQVEGK